MSTYLNAVDEGARFRSTYPNLKKGFFISSADLLALVSQDGITLDGVRGYLGIDADNNLTMNVVGVLKDTNGALNDYNVTNVKATRPCPMWCSAQNTLNT